MAEVRVDLAQWQVLPLFGAVVLGAITVGIMLVTIAPRVEALETEQAIARAIRVEQGFRLCELEGLNARDCDPEWGLVP